MTLLPIILSVLSLVLSGYIVLLLRKSKENGDSSEIKRILGSIDTSVNRFETLLKDELTRSRTEAAQGDKIAREELSQSLGTFGSSLTKQVLDIATSQKDQLISFATQINQANKETREELRTAFKSFEGSFGSSMKELVQITETRLDKMRETMEGKLKLMQDDNSEKLEKMRATVDEKLHATLETRLGQSFKMVTDKLDLVHKGLGEMQVLATGVGDLKKVLSNVKTRGVLGEYQLANILEQLFTPEQYQKNIKTKQGSDAMVEFAIKLPGREDQSKVVLLPIDSKFPSEDYQLLLEAYEKADKELIDISTKQLSNRIKTFAKDIRDKYIDPPNTTDFGIMFLPFEGLYAEVLRCNGLFECLQRDFKVTIVGPTTLSAFLNSLQMGFRTLAIEKRSSEVWEVLGAVKTEFGRFGEILDKTQKKLTEASNVIQDAGVRSRAIERKLRDVQELPKAESIQLLGTEIASEVSEALSTDETQTSTPQ